MRTFNAATDNVRSVNHPITIRRVANGYIVHPEFAASQTRCVSVPDPDTVVFESLSALHRWMRRHFPVEDGA